MVAMTNKNFFSKLFNQLIFSLSIVGLCGNSAYSQSDVVALLPLSGPQSEFGVAVERGLVMALEKSDLHLVVEDHKGKPAEAAGAFEASVSRHSPRTLVVFGSNTSLAVAQKAQDRSLPMIAIATSDLIQKDRPFIYRHMLSPVISAELLVAEVSRRKLSTVAAVTTIHDGMLAFKQSFATKLDMALVDDVQVESGETDFRGIALSLIRKKPSGIFIGLMPPLAGLFARSIRSLGFKGELFASNQIDMPSEFKSAGAAFDGLWFSRDGASRESEFEKQYRERYKEDPATFALNGYDVGVMLKDGLHSENLVNYLSALSNFKGALGTYGANSDRSFSIPGSLWKLSGGVPSPM